MGFQSSARWLLSSIALPSLWLPLFPSFLPAHSFRYKLPNEYVYSALIVLYGLPAIDILRYVLCILYYKLLVNFVNKKCMIMTISWFMLLLHFLHTYAIISVMSRASRNGYVFDFCVPSVQSS